MKKIPCWGREESRKTAVWEQLTLQIYEDNSGLGRGTIPEKTGLGTQRITNLPGAFRAGVRKQPGKVPAGNRYTQRISKIPGELRAGVREHPGKVRSAKRYTKLVLKNP
jgi:hypothetical protein